MFYAYYGMYPAMQLWLVIHVQFERLVPWLFWMFSQWCEYCLTVAECWGKELDTWGAWVCAYTAACAPQSSLSQPLCSFAGVHGWSSCLYCSCAVLTVVWCFCLFFKKHLAMYLRLASNSVILLPQPSCVGIIGMRCHVR